VTTATAERCTPATVAADFFRTLFPPGIPGCLSVCRADPTMGEQAPLYTDWFTPEEADRAAERAVQLSQSYHVWFGTCLRGRLAKGRGRSEDVTVIDRAGRDEDGGLLGVAADVLG